MSSQGPLPYLAFCGVEVANAARIVEYLRAGLGNTSQGRWSLGSGDLCGVLYRVNGGGCLVPDVYASPSVDPAPWYDPTEIGSSSFLGVLLLDITGYDSTVTRAVTPRVQSFGGGWLGAQERVPRKWDFRAALISADDAGAEYGLRWLTDVLSANACDECSSCDLTVRLVCPPPDCADDTVGEWFSYEAALVDGPHETQKWAPGPAPGGLYGCRDVVEVTWSMVAQNPLLYKRPEVCLSPEIVGVNTVCDDICDFLFGDPGTAHCCTVTPPMRGAVAPIYTFDSISGMGPLILGAYSICPSQGETTPVFELLLDHVPPETTVIVNCGREQITVTDALGNVFDGQYLIDLSGGHPLQWPHAADCDDVTCFCARTAHPCSQGGDTLVQIETQLREG